MTFTIACCLLMKLNYGLRYRQSMGFLTSLLQLMGKEDLPVPDCTTLCRRQGILPVEISNRLNKGENLVVGVDSTGLKVYGEGEWKVRKHGWSKHRTWRKLHVCADLVTREILPVELTGNEQDDASVGSRMLKGESHRLKSFRGDGAYDKFGFREVLGNAVRQVIPPPKNGAVTLPEKKKPLPEYLIQRNETIEYIRKEGLEAWKEKEKYHQGV
ncbi:MAG: IS5 family transposase [Prevotellaceae bacterium]|nr:IS5 family transposase [Prevotellaceae bacterium]